MDVDDRLEVKVVAGRSLCEVPGGLANPYCVVKVGDQFEQTAIMARTLNPKWGDAALTMVFNELVENGIEWIVVSVMHKDMSGGRDMPVGVCKVPLVTVLNAPGTPIEEWVPIQHVPGMPSQPPSDSALKLSLTYFIGSDGTIPNPDDFIDDEKETRPPNMLVCTIGKARKLRAPPGKAACDSYITVSVAGSKSSTRTINNTNMPKFDDTFQMPVSDGEATIVLKCKARSGISKKTIGVCKIPMVEIAACGDEGLSKWCSLQPEDYTMDTEERGEVEVRFIWKHDKKYRRSLAGMLSGIGGLFAAGAPKDSQDAEPVKKQAASKNEVSALENFMLEEEEVKLSPKEMEEIEQQRRDRVQMAEGQLMQMEKAAEEAIVKPGDYQVQVHIIECRDLKGEDVSGLSDPYVKVSVMGKTRKTRIQKQVANCVYDETLFFNFSQLEKQEVEEAAISIEVKDWDFIGSHDMIGGVNFDMIKVYSQPGHEVYRQWAGLLDAHSSKDNGYQGYVKLSVVVLGPGDAQVFHDAEAEYQEELLKEASGGAGAAALSMQGPTIKKKLNFLVMYIWQADDVPKMDNFTLMGGAGIEAYVKCEFGGQKPIKTSCHHCRGSKQNLNPVWEEELWIPVYEPHFSERITISLWDRDLLSADKPVAHCYFDYKQVVRTPKVEAGGGWFGGVKYTASRPRWVSLYGAPLGMQAKKGFAAIANTMPDEASTYRGRLLVSSEIIETAPKKEKELAHMKEFRFSIKPSMYPAMAKYQLRAAVILGSEIPLFSFPNAQGASQMKVVVSVGVHRLEFPFKPNNKGTVVWNTTLIDKNLEFPADLMQLPDLIVYLVRGPPATSSVSFARIPAARLIAEQFSGVPFWQTLQRDKCRDSSTMSSIDLNSNPGAVLLRLGFGLNDDSREVKWDDLDGKKLGDVKPYCLRVHIFQGRGLPASDDNGLLDPYVKVRFCGRKKKTKCASETTSPLFYETLEFHELLPADLNYAPDVILQVWDKDFGPKSNTAMAQLRIPPGDVQLSKHEGSPRPTPTWMRLTDIGGSPVAGELLVSMQLIVKRELGEKFNKAPDIKPLCRQAWVEIICVGVRNLKPFGQPGMNSIREPFVKMVIPGVDEPNIYQTNPSRTPRGRDANFISHTYMTLELPENPVFAPMMDIKVYDTRASGLSKPLIGACAIPLDVKMPWNSEGYVAPLSDLFDESEAFKRAEAEQKAREDAIRKRQEEEDKEDEEEGAEDEEDEDDDDDGDNVEDALLPELERRADATDAKDTGTGAFEAGSLADLPMVHEDAVFAERLMKEAVDIEEGGTGGAPNKSWWDAAEGALGDQLGDLGLNSGPEEYSLNDLPINFPTTWSNAEYLTGREWWLAKGGGSLEEYLRTKPFEGYQVYRGKFNPDPSKSTLRPVGMLKAIIRVLDSDPREAEDEFISMRALETKRYAVRVYVIKASSLQPKDASGTSDPFLRVKLGQTVIEHTKLYQSKTLNPDFFQVFEFHTHLPGPSLMKIQVKDYNSFRDMKSHQLIGETLIDLEDRWFHKSWQELDKGSEPYHGMRPVEARPLMQYGTSTQQGQLQLWVEVLPITVARTIPPTKMEGPEPTEFEIRVIIWKSEEVPNMDGETSDLYVKVWTQGSKKLETDTHWRCRQGKGSWNYRMKFPVTLPMKQPEYARLMIQMWEQDIVSSDDIVGESSLDMYRWMMLAYQEHRRVNIFQEINDAIKRKKAMDAGLEDEEDAADDSGSVVEGSEGGEGDAGDEEMGMAGGEQDATGEEKTGDAEEGGVPATDEGEDKPLLDKEDGGADDDDDDDAAPPKRDDSGDAAAMIKQMKELAGIGELDSSAQWCVFFSGMFCVARTRLTVCDVLSGCL